MPANDANLLFLETKINEIKIAIFRADSGEEMRMPNNIVSTIKTDTEGNIWFFTACNADYARNMNEHFHAYLEYYQKGQDCRLSLSGKARIVQDEISDAEVEKDSATTNIALIKFKILYAEYFENKSSNISITKKVKSFFTDIFIPNSRRIFDFT
ncbi:MAG: pyridoxamine 5'-phosphate oxidase family protein [Ferruginibacter sp.]